MPYAAARPPNAALSHAYIGAATKRVIGPPTKKKPNIPARKLPVSHHARRRRPPSAKAHAAMVAAKASQLSGPVVIAL